MGTSLEASREKHINKTYNCLTIIDVIQNYKTNGKKNGFLAVCKCICGNICSKSLRKVTSGHTKSCGCYKSNILQREFISKLKLTFIGKKYNRLTVLDVFKENGATKFRCECDCGNIVTAYKKNVITNKTKSCGCLHREIMCNNKEFINYKTVSNSLKLRYKNDPSYKIKLSIKSKQAYINDPTISSRISSSVKEWRKNNPEKVAEQITKQSLWRQENKEKLQEIGKHYSDICAEKRKHLDFSCLVPYVHPDDLSDLLDGKITSKSRIRTLCPICNMYYYHSLNSVYKFNTQCLKNNRLTLCQQCANTIAGSSKSEQEIANYIATFYSGECIRNSRGIIAPLELDLYYPEKSIAIEFNGDYWHSDLYKPNNYHYDKFIMCKNKHILLISIFELEWNTHKEDIKSYLKDIFCGIDNKLSYKENYMNNNYPSINYEFSHGYIEDYYTTDKYTIQTCGYSYIN